MSRLATCLGAWVTALVAVWGHDPIWLLWGQSVFYLVEQPGRGVVHTLLHFIFDWLRCLARSRGLFWEAWLLWSNIQYLCSFLDSVEAGGFEIEWLYAGVDFPSIDDACELRPGSVETGTGPPGQRYWDNFTAFDRSCWAQAFAEAYRLTLALWRQGQILLGSSIWVI